VNIFSMSIHFSPGLATGKACWYFHISTSHSCSFSLAASIWIFRSKLKFSAASMIMNNRLLTRYISSFITPASRMLLITSGQAAL